MQAVARTAHTTSKPWRVGAPPLPHEHGAWAMLYIPLALAFLAKPPPAPATAILLIAAVTAAFLAREPADLLIRGKGRDGTAFWLVVYAGAMVACGGALVAGLSHVALLPVAGVAAALFAIHAALLVWPSARRADRSTSGEVLAVAGLTLTAPAALAVSTGSVGSAAIALWAVSAAYFTSSIFFVKMLLGGVKHKGAIGTVERLRIGRVNLMYHGLLLGALLWLAATGAAGALLAAAFAPITGRALFWNARLSRRLPNLKRIGFIELGFALWFLGFAAAAFRMVLAA